MSSSTQPMGISEAAANTVSAEEDTHSLLGSGNKSEAYAGQRSGSRACNMARVVILSCSLGGIAALVAAFGYLYPPASIMSPHVLVVCAFLISALFPAFTSCFLACSRSPRMALIHIGVVATITILLACGLITNIRVLDASDMSEYCETHNLVLTCSWSVEAATMVTLVLIGLIAILGSLAGFYSYRLRADLIKMQPQPIRAETPKN